MQKMSIYEPEHKSKLYLVFVALVAALLGWGIYINYRSMIIAANCSEIAARSSGLLGTRYKELNSDFSYNEVKNDCIKQALNSGK